MQDQPKYVDLQLRAYISSYHPTETSFSLIDGLSQELRMEGNVNDPFVDPIGNIFPHERGSNFSYAPIQITIKPDTDIIAQSCKRHGSEAIGAIAIRKNVEVENFELDGTNHVDHPIKVFIALPWAAITAIERTLEQNVVNKKLGYLNLILRADETKLISTPDEHTSESILSVKHLNTAIGLLDLGVFKFTFGQTIFENDHIHANSEILLTKETQEISSVQNSTDQHTSSFLQDNSLVNAEFDKLHNSLQDFSDILYTRENEFHDRISELSAHLDTIQIQISKLNEATQKPNDLISKILLRIPIINSLLRYFTRS